MEARYQLRQCPLPGIAYSRRSSKSTSHTVALWYDKKMNQIKSRAKELRQQGLTYREIQDLLGKRIPKSTLSYWFKDIQLDETQVDRIRNLALEKLEKARHSAQTANKKIFEDRLARSERAAQHVVENLSDREARIALSMLYLGEGGKYPVTRGLYFGSSEPRIVSLYIQLLTRCYHISMQQLKCSVYFRADQNIIELRRYWSMVTGIPLTNFYSSQPDPRTANKPTRNKNYKGVARIYHRGTDIQLELDHIANALLEEVSLR